MTISPNENHAPLTKSSEQAQIERLAHFLDSAIPLPFLNYSIGWEPIIGLIPGIGDLAGLLLSGVIIVQAARLGTPKTVLLYMILNAGIESLIGIIPIVGDLFDFVWKANTRNVKLMQRALNDPQGAKRHSRTSMTALFSSVFLILAGLILGVGALGWTVWQWVVNLLS
ncbi:MAG: DUF4112 domain-containing protein [Caldilineaceae bacterium]